MPSNSDPRPQAPNPNHQRADIELVPIESDQYGNARRFAVARFDDPSPSQPPAVIDAAPIVSPLPAPAQPSLITVTQGSHADRARAFGITTFQLSLVTGVLFTIASIALAGQVLPLFTLALVYFGGFSLTWAFAYLLHVLSSAEGVELYSVHRMWGFLDREQAERWKRYGTKPPRPRWKEIGDRVMAVFIVVYVGLFLLAWLYVRNGGG